MRKTKPKKSIKKSHPKLLIIGMVTVIAISSVLLIKSLYQNNLLSNFSDNPNVVTLPFKYPDGDLLFNLVLDKTTGENFSNFSKNAMEFRSSMLGEYLQWARDPNIKGGSVTYDFTYFITEQAMTRYVQGSGPHDYSLTYPVPEVAKTHNKTYIYYDTKNKNTQESYSTGAFYDWDYQGLVHGYQASLISYYHNYYEENRNKPFFSESSAPGNSYCVINLHQVNQSLTGYLLFSGMRSAGTSDNFCEILDNMKTFAIIPGNQTVNERSIKMTSINQNSYKNRDEVWLSVGDLSPDVFTPIINPVFSSNPMWPNLRQAYRVIRLPNGNTILATDGLSDPFGEDHPNKRVTNGYELELYLITDEDISQPSNTWQFDVVYQTALQVAHHGELKSLLDKHSLLSLEIYDTRVPAHYMKEDRVGVLLGISSKIVPKSIELPLGEIYLVSITLLTQEELQYAAKGNEFRNDLSDKLLNRLGEPISTTQRESVI